MGQTFQWFLTGESLRNKNAWPPDGRWIDGCWTTVKQLSTDSRNLSGIPISGEVWLDELRLSGVKRDKGVSMRLQSRFNVADLVNTSFAYRRQDADFHTLQRRLGSNRSNESLNINAGFNLDKLMPSEWGIKVPVSTSFAQAINKPKYLPGQDVLVDQSSPPDSILNINN